MQLSCVLEKKNFNLACHLHISSDFKFMRAIARDFLLSDLIKTSTFVLLPKRYIPVKDIMHF